MGGISWVDVTPPRARMPAMMLLAMARLLPEAVLISVEPNEPEQRIVPSPTLVQLNFRRPGVLAFQDTSVVSPTRLSSLLGSTESRLIGPRARNSLMASWSWSMYSCLPSASASAA